MIRLSSRRYSLSVLIAVWSLVPTLGYLYAQARWQKAEALNLAPEKAAPLARLLSSIDDSLQDFIAPSSSHQPATKLLEQLPQSRSLHSQKTREYLETRIELYGLAPFEVKDSAIEIYHDRRSKPLRVDFSRIWQNQILVNGYVISNIMDRDWPTILEEDVQPFLQSQGLVSRWSLENQFSLIPTAFAFGSCTQGQIEASKNTASLTGDVVTACVNPIGLAVGGGIAAVQGMHTGVKEKSLAAGLRKTCEEMPVIGPTYKLIQQGNSSNESSGH